jgi:hypothetical protein
MASTIGLMIGSSDQRVLQTESAWNCSNLTLRAADINGTMNGPSADASGEMYTLTDAAA